MIDEDNAVPAEVAPAADPDVTFVKTSIKEIDVYLINENSAVNACLSAGLNLNFDNLVNEKYNQRISVHIPEIVATAVANQEDYTKSSPRVSKKKLANCKVFSFANQEARMNFRGSK